MAAFEPVIAFLAIAAPLLALAGVLVEWVAQRRRLPHPKSAPAAGVQRKTES
jgi:hypothetical protein